MALYLGNAQNYLQTVLMNRVLFHAIFLRVNLRGSVLMNSFPNSILENKKDVLNYKSNLPKACGIR